MNNKSNKKIVSGAAVILAAASAARATLVFQATAADFNTATNTFVPDIGPAGSYGILGAPTVVTGATPTGASAIALNGQSAFTFPSAITSSGAFTIFAVMQPSADFSSPQTIVAGDNNQVQYRIDDTTGPNAGEQALLSRNAFQYANGQSPLNANFFSVIDATQTPGASVQFYQNGNYDGDPGGTAIVPLNVTVLGAAYDSNVAAYSEFFRGNIAEVLIYNSALTSTQRAAVEYQLNAQYISAGSAPPVSSYGLSGAGDWNDYATWTPEISNATGVIPNAIGAEADFGNTLSAAHTVYSDFPITVGTLNFNSPNTFVIAGAGSMTLQTSSGLASIIVQQGVQKINLPLTIASSTAINVAPGSTLLISDPLVIDPGVAVTSTGTVTYQSTINVGTGGSLMFSSSTYAPSLQLASGASSSIAASTGTRSLLQLNSLALGTGSSLDLSNNDLIIHGGSLSAVTAMLKAGYNETGGGNWSGPGIQSSAAASNSMHLTALGSMQASSAGTYDGAAVYPGDVIVRYTYYGDANLDGKVDGSDYSKIDAGYASRGTLSGWFNGDFNYDGVIDGSDYALIDNALNNQGSPIGAGSVALVASETAQVAGPTAAVPEPASLGLAAVALVTIVGRRRRSCH